MNQAHRSSPHQWNLTDYLLGDGYCAFDISLEPPALSEITDADALKYSTTQILLDCVYAKQTGGGQATGGRIVNIGKYMP